MKTTINHTATYSNATVGVSKDAMTAHLVKMGAILDPATLSPAEKALHKMISASTKVKITSFKN